MTTIESINLKGQKAGTVKIPDSLEVPVNLKLLTQVTFSTLSNQRRALANAQTRGDSGRTTAKVYRQKHTGRARHGARSAPIFVGGGVAHGPTGQENYRRQTPKKMTRLALCQAISAKINQKSFFVVEGLEKIEPKTKVGSKFLESLKIGKGKVIVASLIKNENVSRALGNLPQVSLLPVSNLGAYSVLSARALVMTDESLRFFEKGKPKEKVEPQKETKKVTKPKAPTKVQRKVKK